MMRIKISPIAALALLRFIAAVIAKPAHAQTWIDVRADINANTTTILSGNPNGTYLYIASDISFVLDDGDALRVLPIVGKGGAQNLRDLVYLRGIDMAIVRSDAFETYKDGNTYGDLASKLRYITRLYNEEMHVLARKDITSIDQLAGRTVNLSDKGSGTQLTTQLIFKKLGIEVNEVNMGQRDGFEALKAGEVDATILVAGKPARSWKTLDIDLEKFHFLPVSWSEPLHQDYLPTRITHEDYPNLIAQGSETETIAVGAILAAYNWEKGTDRYERIARFVDAFFSKIDEFKKPARHPKWREINVAATIANWTRFEPAEQWLREHQAVGGTVVRLKRDFNAFFAANGGPDAQLSSAEKEALFRQFVEWRDANGTTTTNTLTAAN